MADPTSSNHFKQTPGRALLAFAIGACLVAVYTVVDAGRRDQQEGIDQPTALGDQERFAFPEYHTGIPVMEFEGKPLYRQWRDSRYRPDSEMFKVGRDDGDRCYLYQHIEPKSDDRSPPGFYYVKVDDNSFLELSETPKQPEPTPDSGEE